MFSCKQTLFIFIIFLGVVGAGVPKADEVCDHQYCHFQGICRLENGNPKCDCVEGIFEGRRCEQPIDLCFSNPCANGGKCKSFNGSYFCECKANFYGQKCDTKKKAPISKAHLMYNHVVAVEEDVHFLLVCEEIGSIESILEIKSDRHAIASFILKNDTKIWQFSKDLRSMASERKIRNPKHLPFKSGYFWETKTKMGEVGTVKIVLKVEDLETSIIYFNHTFNMAVFIRPGSCYPIVRYVPCELSRKPMPIGIGIWNFVVPQVERSCSKKSELDFKWSVTDFLDTKTYHKFSNLKIKHLEIEPYLLRFGNETDTFFLLYVLKLVAKETHNDRQGTSIFRCYINVKRAAPFATIDGGHLREINFNKPETLDGSKSRNRMLPENVPQRLKYIWSCNTKDETDTFCKQEFKEGMKLDIPPNSLKLRVNYNFTLKITAALSQMSKSTWQLIVPIELDPLKITINCVKNCLNNIANDKNDVYLRAKCSNCNDYPLKYKWSVVDKPKIKLEPHVRIVIPKENFTKSAFLEVQVNVTQRRKYGLAQYQLEINKNPTKGKCIVEPREGIEMKTLFTFSCTGFIDEFEPISYKFYQLDYFLHETNTGYFQTYLALSNSTKKYRVQVCDYLEACTYKNMNITVKKAVLFNDSQHIMEFLNPPNPEEKLKNKIAVGRVAESVNMIDIATRELANIQSNDSNMDVVILLFEALSSIEIHTFSEMYRSIKLLRGIFGRAKLDADVAVSLGLCMKEITKSISLLAERGLLEKVAFYDYKNMETFILKVTEKFFYENEHFPVPHDLILPQFTDPFLEDYADYGELSVRILENIEKWKTATYDVLGFYVASGATVTQLYEPGEIKTNVLVFKNVTWRIDIFDREELNYTTITANSCSITFGESYFTSYRKMKKYDKFGIQTMIFLKTPFWWYPEDRSIKSPVIGLNVFPVQKNEENQYIDLYISFHDHRKFLMKTIAFINGTMDMPVYNMSVLKSSTVLFKFSKVEADIQFMVAKRKRPKYKQVLNDYKLIYQNETEQIIEYQIIETGDDFVDIFAGFISHDRNTSRLIYFNMEVHVISCRLWNFSTHHWTSSHCIVGNNGNSTHIHCRCNHLSFLTSKIFLTPNKLILPRDIILTIEGSYVILIFNGVLALVFAALMGWACYQDKIDFKKRQIIHIGSKHCSNKYTYLITISTGNVPFSGTTAHVSIQLHGERCSSEIYLLYTHEQKLFQKNSEHTFSVHAGCYLGPLRSITLSHDMVGRYPSWYCDTVRVKDVCRREEFLFIARRWLSLIFANAVSADIQLATAEQLMNLRFLVKEHVMRGFRDGYVLYSLLVSHPRSALTRKEKAMVFAVGISFAAMLNILYFGRSTIDNIEEEREIYRKIIFSARIFLHTLLCTIAGMIVGYFIVFLFMKAKPAIPWQYTLVLNEK